MNVGKNQGINLVLTIALTDGDVGKSIVFLELSTQPHTLGVVVSTLKSLMCV